MRQDTTNSLYLRLALMLTLALAVACSRTPSEKTQEAPPKAAVEKPAEEAPKPVKVVAENIDEDDEGDDQEAPEGTDDSPEAPADEGDDEEGDEEEGDEEEAPADEGEGEDDEAEGEDEGSDAPELP